VERQVSPRTFFLSYNKDECKITNNLFRDLRESRCRASAAAALGHTMLMDALALAVKFIPFETYLLETSTHTNIAVTCRAGLIINAGIYQCVYVRSYMCVCECQS
jgi:hypothetical protein